MAFKFGEESESFLKKSIGGFGDPVDPFLIEQGYVEEFTPTYTGDAAPTTGVQTGRRQLPGEDPRYEEYQYYAGKSMTPEVFQQLYGISVGEDYNQAYKFYTQAWNRYYNPGIISLEGLSDKQSAILGPQGKAYSGKLQGGTPLYKDVEKVLTWYEAVSQQYKGQRDAWDKLYGKWLAPAGATRFARPEEEGTKELKKETLLAGA